MKNRSIIWIVLAIVVAGGLAGYFLIFNNQGKMSENISEIEVGSSEIKDFFAKHPDFAPYAKDLAKFYRDRDFKLAWFDEDGMIEQAFQMYIASVNAGDKMEGKLVPYRDELIKLFGDEPSSKTIVPIDLMLSAQFFHYDRENFTEDLSERQTRALNWLIKRDKADPAEMLNNIIENKTNLYDGESMREGYSNLKLALSNIKTKGLDKLEPITSEKKKFEPGDSSSVLLKVRERLVLLGDMTANNNSSVLDTALISGIKNFQIRHGIEPDGVPGQGFFEALNVPGSVRVKQILANMERYRWIADRGNKDYLFVNIPDYKLYAYKNDSLLWEMNVVVGQDLNKTVIFEGDISYIVFSPYWNIPASIVTKEILPGIESNPNYLEEKNMEIYGENEGDLPNIRQKPGPNNSLGKAKFMFPNSHSIYLHDSPAKSLFTNTERAYSHGCVRVANSEFLANYLLQGQKGWTPERIKEAMDKGEETTVNLEKPMPVYITYFTAFVDKNGKLNFRKDIYNRDQKLMDVLF